MKTPTDSQTLRRAWISLILVPVGIILELVIGEVLPGLLGYGWTHEQEMPVGPTVLVALPALLLSCVPGILAGYFGLRARAAGERIGLVPAIIGLTVAGYFLLLYIVALLFGPLGG